MGHNLPDYNLSKVQSNIERGNLYLDSYPYQVHFLMIDKCNVKCIMCGGDYFRSQSGRRITLEKFKIMAANLKLEHARAIVLAGWGDPLLNRDLVPIIRFVRDSYPHIAISVTTNGLALVPKLSGRLLEQGVSMVNISINSATRATYRRIMQIDGFEAVCRNARAFVEQKKMSGAPTILQFSAAINRINIEELPRLVELSMEIGVTSINLFYTRFYPERLRNLNIDDPADRLQNDACLFFHQELSDEMVVKARDLARRYRISLTHEPLFRDHAPPCTCTWPMSQVMVGFDGEIYPCGGSEVHFREKVEKGIYDFGNALKAPVDAFWNSEIYRNLRISSRQGSTCLIPECRCCANTICPNDIRSHIMHWDEEAAGDNRQANETACSPVVEQPIVDPPLVSVIVPTYNRPDMLINAVKSILGQTFSNYEIIVVNDGGEDVSELLEPSGNCKIRYLRHDTNRGLSAARNTGIRAARGKYIAYLDDDDLFYPDHLEVLVNFLEANDFHVAYTDAHRAYQERQGSRYITTKKEVPYSFDFDYERILRENFIPVLCVMHRRTCLDTVGFFDETLRSLEDWDLWMRMSRNFHFAHIPLVTCSVSWREDGSTMTSGRQQEMREAHSIVSERGRKYQSAGKIYPEIPKATPLVNTSPAADAHAGILKIFVSSGKRAEAIFALGKLLESFPDYAPAHNDLGVLYGEEGKLDKALAAYEKAVSLDPASATFKKNLADFLYVAMKRPEEAAHHYERVLELDPRDMETLLILGNLRVDGQDFSGARECYLRALEIDPANDLAGKMFDALEARAEDPGQRNSDTLLREARCLARRGRSEQAVQLLEALLSVCPDHAAAHNDLGNLYCLLQTPDEALSHLERAVTLAPDTIDFVRDLADFHLAERGDVEGALSLYNKALTIKPDDIETLLRIGNVCAAVQQFDHARFFYSKVLSIEAGNSQAEENLAVLQRMADERTSTPDTDAGTAGGSLRIEAPRFYAKAANDAENSIRSASQLKTSRTGECGQADILNQKSVDRVDALISSRMETINSKCRIKKGLQYCVNSPESSYDILIPIFNAFEHLQRCIDSVIRHTPGNHTIYLLDDCSTDTRVVPLLRSFEKADSRIRVIESTTNRGFVCNVNRGFEMSENDVVILNSDTEVTSGWLDRMHRCLHSHPDIGIVCPLSNNATILSVPVMNNCNSLPEGMSPNDFAALVAKVSRTDYPEIPTGVGFCMLISRDTLKRTGFFDPAFGLGYGEENDLCMKARAAGKKIVCCDDAYVQHYGEASFCRIDRIDDKRKRNEILLNEKWPHYRKEIYTFCCVNPLREVQERILAAIRDHENPVLPEVLHVIHNFDAPGGTELHTRNIIDGLAERLRSTVIYPAPLPDQWVDLAANEVNGYLRVLKLRKESIAVNDSFVELYGDLTNTFVETVFANVLRGGRYSIVHFQHLGGWSSLLLPLIAKDQGCKVVISLHDYYLLCPEYNLILPDLRRCGKNMPDAEDAECLYCLGTKRKYHGAGKPSLLQDYLVHRKLIVKRVFEAADMLIAPSDFVRDRFIQAYKEEIKDKIVTVPHGIEHLDKSKRSKRGHALRVGFLGNASDRKGVFTLLQAARILKGRPIQFEIFGGVPPSLTKMASELGIVQHGFYNRSDLPRLLAKTHLVMIPSVWDETFCLTASESQMMGIPVIASDCGAISERIADGKTGFLVSPGDAKALAARLLEILDNPSLLEEVTANLRDHRLKTMRENVEDYARIYDRLLGVPARRDSGVHPHPMPIPSGRNLTSIVILTFNELEYTKRCVESIRRHTPEPHEIIFVDNGSKDGTVQWLRELVKQNSHIKLIENGRNLGFAKGCNQGIGAAAGEFILLLNNDTVATEGWLAGILECLHRMPDAGIVGPMTNHISGIQRVETVDYDSIDGLDDYARSFRQKNRRRCIETRRLVGFCMLFRKDLVVKIGPLDESFGTGNFEDDDFCVRAALAGYRNAIAGDVFIHHFGSRSFIGNCIDYGTALAGNRKLYTDKWHALERKAEEGGKIRSLVAREKAQEQFMRGNVQGAVDLWLVAIRHLPGDHRAYHEMADGLIRAKRFRDALDVLNAVPAGPASAERLVLEGRCREGLDELDKAEEMADKALSARADCSSALNLRGVVAFRRGAANEARSFFGKAAEAGPSWGEPLTNLGVLAWAEGRHEEALELLEKGFTLTPRDSDLAERYHAAAATLGLQARAEKVFREARGLYPASRTIAFLLIDLLISQEKHAAAMAEIEAAMAAFEVDDGFIDAALEVRCKLGPMAIGDTTPRPALTLCMIVRNEQSNLVRCLSSIKAAVDEIIVVDTGSTDRTKDLAAVFGARVFDFAWNDDFSRARNFSLSKAQGDWILVLDADETISPADHRRLRDLIRKSPKKIGGYDLATRNYVIEANTAGWTANDGSYPGEEAGTGWYANRKVRLFRNDSRIRFSGAVHELVEASMAEAKMKIAVCDVPVHHTGKLDRARVTEKGERYFELGMKKIEETGGTPRSVLELAVQAGELGRWDDAVDLWRRFLRGKPGHEVNRAYVNLINACLNADRFDEALAEARKAETLANGTRELALNCAAAEFFAGDLRKAASMAQRLLQKHTDYPPALGLLAMSLCLTGQEERSLACMQRLQQQGLDTRSQLLPAVAKLRAAGKDEQADRLQDLIERHYPGEKGCSGPAYGPRQGDSPPPLA